MTLKKIKIDNHFTKSQLIDLLVEAIPLPSWAGRNWDALSECLRYDLPKNERIFISHGSAFELECDADLIQYCEILEISKKINQNFFNYHFE